MKLKFELHDEKYVQGTQKFVWFRWFFELCELELKEFSCKSLLVNSEGTDEFVRWFFELQEFELHEFNCISEAKRINRNNRYYKMRCLLHYLSVHTSISVTIKQLNYNKKKMGSFKSLRKTCLNTEFFLVRISPYLDWIWRFTP